MADGLRERKKHQTRDAVTAAAHDLFRERGFDAVTVDEIAAAANVSPRTVFRYFGSKEAILFGDHGERLELIREAIAARPAGEPIMVVLREAVIEITERTAEHRELQLTRTRLAASGASVTAYTQTVLIPLWEDALTEAVAARLDVDPAVNIRPRLLAGTAISAMSAASGLWLASNGDGDVVGLLHEAFDALHDAVVESLPGAPADVGT
ncbi:MAG: TetR family transcriptional regulator [Acidimicrobiales bacterium]